MGSGGGEFCEVRIFSFWNLLFRTSDDKPENLGCGIVEDLAELILHHMYPAIFLNSYYLSVNSYSSRAFQYEIEFFRGDVSMWGVCTLWRAFSTISLLDSRLRFAPESLCWESSSDSIPSSANFIWRFDACHTWSRRGRFFRRRQLRRAEGATRCIDRDVRAAEETALLRGRGGFVYLFLATRGVGGIETLTHARRL